MTSYIHTSDCGKDCEVVRRGACVCMVRREEWGNAEEEEEGGGVAIRLEEKGEEGGEGIAAAAVFTPTANAMKPADMHK